MGVSAIIFLAITAFFAVRGYFNGFWGSLARTVSFLGAYGAAFYFAKPGAAQVKANTPLDGILAYIAAGIGIFIVVMVAIRVLFWVLAKLSPSGDGDPGTGSRLAGTAIGALVGALIGLLLVYTLGVYSSAKELEADTTNHGDDNLVDRAARATISKSAGVIMSLSGANKNSVQLGEAFIADPVNSVDRLTRVTQNPDLEKLLTNRRTQRLMKQGDVDELMDVPEFRRLMENEDMKQLMTASGLDVNTQDSARETAKKLTVAWQQVQVMKNDPRVQQIVKDPEFQQQLEADNKIPLLMNPKLNELAEIIFVDGTGTLAAASADSEITIKEIKKGADATVDKDSGAVYKYEDEHGQVHYSDRPVDDR